MERFPPIHDSVKLAIASLPDPRFLFLVLVDFLPKLATTTLCPSNVFTNSPCLSTLQLQTRTNTLGNKQHDTTNAQSVKGRWLEIDQQGCIPHRSHWRADLGNKTERKRKKENATE
jgi:hypothetical protein